MYKTCLRTCLKLQYWRIFLLKKRKKLPIAFVSTPALSCCTCFIFCTMQCREKMLNAHELKQNMNLILWETCSCIINHNVLFYSFYLRLCWRSYSSCSDFFFFFSPDNIAKLHPTTIVFQLFFRQLKNEQGSLLVELIIYNLFFFHIIHFPTIGYARQCLSPLHLKPAMNWPLISSLRLFVCFFFVTKKMKMCPF